MALGALFNPQRAGGARIMPETGAALAVTTPHFPRSRSSETGSCT